MNARFSAILTPLFVLFAFFPVAFSGWPITLLRMACAVCAVLYLVKNSAGRFPRISPLIWLALAYLSLLVVISAVQGTSYASMGTVAEVATLAVALVYFCFVLRTAEEETVNAIALVFFVLIVLDVISVDLFPEGLPGTSSTYGAQYLFGNKNNHTLQMVVLVLAMCWRCKFGGRRYKAEAAACVALCLLLTAMLFSSTTIVSIAALALGALLYLLGVGRIRVNAVVVLIAAAVLNVMLILGITGFLKVFVEMLGKDLSFSYRTMVWDNALPCIAQKPLFGWGVLDYDVAVAYLGRINAHNQALDSLFTGGVVLFALFVACLVMLALKINGITSNGAQVFAASVLASLLLKMMFEQILTGLLAWFVFLLLAEFSHAHSSGGAQRVLAEGD